MRVPITITLFESGDSPVGITFRTWKTMRLPLPTSTRGLEERVVSTSLPSR